MNSRIIIWAAVALFATSCQRSSNETWENVKTAGRYLQKGVDSMWGKDSDSKMLSSNDEFIGPYDEFIPFDSSDLRNISKMDMALPQPRGIPGMSGTPTFDRFTIPDDALGIQFVHFDTDEHFLRNPSDMKMVQRIALYMKNHPNSLLLIEGHTDERASASYNMALGMRRSNYVRQLLVKSAVDLNRIYTVSKGKEQPAAQGHSSEDWKQNRRAEFKIFEP